MPSAYEHSRLAEERIVEDTRIDSAFQRAIASMIDDTLTCSLAYTPRERLVRLVLYRMNRLRAAEANLVRIRELLRADR